MFTSNNQNLVGRSRSTMTGARRTAIVATDENMIPIVKQVVVGKEAAVGKSIAMPLQAKQTNSSATTRKRAALGEKTNVVAQEQQNVEELKDKKMAKPRIRIGKVPLQDRNAVTEKAERPVVEKLVVVERPVVERPVVERPVVEKPVTVKPAVKPAVKPIRSTGIVVTKVERTEVQVVKAKHVLKRSARPAESHVAKPLDNIEEAEAYEAEIDRRRAKKAKVQEWEDLDAEDWNDPVMVSEYVVEIFEYMKQLELDTMPNPNYMEQQKELQWKMRGILVDWLVEVHNKFRLLPETLFLTVNIIDRFLSLRVVSLVKFQLVGVTALFIAAKYEEVMAPSIHNFTYMADGGYTQEDIIKAERYMLQVLEFKLGYPSPLSFLRRNSKADCYDIEARTIAKYLMEISLVDHRFLACTPSEIAAASLYLSRKMLNRNAWDANLVHYSGYAESQLIKTVNTMLDYVARPVAHAAFFKKYTSKKFMKASVFVRDWVERRLENY